MPRTVSGLETLEKVVTDLAMIHGSILGSSLRIGPQP